jgi:hypothetical protein
MKIDWPRFRATAAQVAALAYAPYSRLRLGAAGLTIIVVAGLVGKVSGPRAEGLPYIKT